jgi:hypothetical protein
MDLERILAEGTPEEWRALELHARSCKECESELVSWKELSTAGQELRQEWDSPQLWPRIAKALRERQSEKPSWSSKWREAWRISLFSWRTAAAAVALIAFTAAGAWFALQQRKDPFQGNPALLRNSAVEEVERAEENYVRAIDKLAGEARPQLENPSTPLMASYHEKLLVLDSAIAELRAEADRNPANAHIRRELLAMYQEKQNTLEQVLEEKP